MCVGRQCNILHLPYGRLKHKNNGKCGITMNLQQKRRELVFCAVNIALPLLAGAYIYIRIGRDSYFGNLICELFNISKISANSEIREFFRNWGGDFLWAYALFFAVYALRRSFSEGGNIAMVALINNIQTSVLLLTYYKSGYIILTKD